MAHYWVAVNRGNGKNATVVVDVYPTKDNVEIVGWRSINDKGLEKLKKQAEREDGQLLMLSPDDGSAADLSALASNLPSQGIVSQDTDNGQLVTPRGAQKSANTAYPDASAEIRAMASDETRYSLADEAKALIIKKRPDIDAVDSSVAEILKFPDSKTARPRSIGSSRAPSACRRTRQR